MISRKQFYAFWYPLHWTYKLLNFVINDSYLQYFCAMIHNCNSNSWQHCHNHTKYLEIFIIRIFRHCKEYHYHLTLDFTISKWAYDIWISIFFILQKSKMPKIKINLDVWRFYNSKGNLKIPPCLFFEDQQIMSGARRVSLGKVQQELCSR